MLGIASFSEVFDHEPMWAHYASNFTGICVAYSFQKLMKQLPDEYEFIRMTYSEKPPILLWSKKGASANAKLALSPYFHKSEIFEIARSRGARSAASSRTFFDDRVQCYARKSNDRAARQAPRSPTPVHARTLVDVLQGGLTGFGRGWNGGGEKPKWMRWRTFERLAAKHDALVGRSLQAMMLKFGGLRDFPE
jgi:hypothetical protein